MLDESEVAELLAERYAKRRYDRELGKHPDPRDPDHPGDGDDEEHANVSADEFYLQDSRTYIGNDVVWWAKNAKGYTTDLSKAQVYTKASALAFHECRETDIPWPKAYIDGKTRPAVDFQYIKRAEALAGTGIVITKTKQQKSRDVCNCVGCGRFISQYDRYTNIHCKNCGADNRA